MGSLDGNPSLNPSEIFSIDQPRKRLRARETGIDQGVSKRLRSTRRLLPLLTEGYRVVVSVSFSCNLANGWV
jgi:hypothetical protein